ncbi:MAG: GyrI-like domain-containing protein [Bacteroidota bacterium]|nr:GyrI-like domain-containing protein [Bacteroidota bacterium]MDP4232285.1 GyrI-like domain-containing protein [Bacteroidota bacterium]MDP4241424.1 GyrI-like domain-containing protein [Bacteroidota bacterium]MDP4286752.1 GyrI-like domain-containing protein [Bacteroidota bacterium]
MSTTKTNDELKELFSASSKTPKVVTVPKMQYLMIDGKGDPNKSKEFQDAVQALYGLAYTMKFDRKKQGKESDYKIAPLEGLWWSENMSDFSNNNRTKWQWTLMLEQPDSITKTEVAKAAKEVEEKKHLDTVSNVRLEKWSEGECAQIMHIGPYSSEAPTIEKLHDFIRDQGADISGKHHEIYLGDPRRSAPEKLKTILRQPLKRQSRNTLHRPA